MSAPDLTVPIRNALLANPLVTDRLPAYLGGFPIFTRRPVPADSPYPNIIVSQDITLGDQDGVNDYRPDILRDVAVYHTSEDPEHDHEIDAIALAVWRMFNRQRYVLSVVDWDVASIRAATPIPFEIGDILARVVQLQILVAQRVAG